MNANYGSLLQRPALTLGVLIISTLVALFWISGILNPAPVAADAAKFYLDCPTTEVREGESVDVFLVRVADHQHSVTFGAYWHTDAGTAGTDDYVHQNSGAVWGNDSERLANRAKRTFETSQDSIVEGSETFTARFTPVDNVVDRNDPTRDEKCEITIIDDDPNITEVEVTSSPAWYDTYGVGETIEISATFNAPVEVDGNPALGMWVGGVWRGARFHRQSADNKVIFIYTVRPEDRDTDGIVMDGGYQDENGRWHNFVNHTAVTAAGTDIVAYRAYRGLPAQSGHKIDGSLLPYGTNTAIISTPASGETYRHGETIYFSIVFSAPLEVEGSPQLNLRVGDVGMGQRGARLEGGSGTTALLFGYTVAPHDLDNDGVTILGTAMETGGIIDAVTILETSRRTIGIPGLGGDGTIKVKGTNTVVTPIFSGLLNQVGHKMDGRPYPQSISITSSPAAESDTYGLDEVIQVSVQFDQNVTAGADAAVILQIGSDSDNSRATYASGNGTPTLVFEYTVESGDTDGDGISGYLPHGHDIKATGTEALYQPGAGEDRNAMTLGVDANHKVEGSPTGADTTAPTISSIAFYNSPGPGEDETYGVGDWVGVKVSFSEDIVVTGRPQIELSIGGNARQARYEPLLSRIEQKADGSENSLLFGYTVQEGDVDSDGLSIGANKVTLNDGTIRDDAANDAVLTHDAVPDNSGHKVAAPDVTGPTVLSVDVTSTPAAGDTYDTDEVIKVTVIFTEDVTVTGSPQLTLDFEGTDKTADYDTADGDEVVFAYTVALNDSDSDGIAIGADKITLNGGTIKDGAENDATVTHSAVAEDPDHKVDGSDTVAPTISTLAFTSDPGEDQTYGAGDTIEITVTFSENVVVTGTPQLEMEFSSTTNKQANYSSVTGAVVVFSYTVVVGDRASDGVGVAANKLTLNGGTIQDSSGNNAVVSHSYYFPRPIHFVNGAGGL